MKRLCAVQLKTNGLLTCLSISTMTLLIFSTIFIITVISITPIIVLGLGQINAGQRDIILYPVKDFFNATKVSELTSQSVMPRYLSPIGIDTSNSAGWFMDFKLEQQNHLGFLETAPQQPQKYVYTHNQFHYKRGDKVEIQLRDSKVLSVLSSQLVKKDKIKYEKVISQIDQLINLYSIKAQFQVFDTFPEAYGKFPVGTVGGYTYLDLSAYSYMVEQTCLKHNITGADSALINYMKNQFDLGQFATEGTINVPNRIEVYSNSDYDETYEYLSSYGAEVLQKVGLFSLQSQIPIGESLEGLSYFGMFIGVILKLVILSLFILSIMMMNNMLNVGIERKAFDFALLKTMGAGRIFIVVNLFVDAMKFVVIANIIAFPCAYFGLWGVSGVFQEFFGYAYHVEPNAFSIFGGFFIGVLVPVVSSIAPIWSVIKDDLAENLNPLTNKTEAIRTEIYVEGKEFPLPKLIFGFIASTYGFMIYYLLPQGLIDEDVTVLLLVFFAILGGLLAGLILLSYSFQYAVQKLIAYLTLFWVNKTDFMLTLKNLSAHRLKNRRTSLLYALSVSFIIFVSVGSSIQMQTIRDQMLKKHGTYIQISSQYGSLEKTYYDNLLTSYDEIIDWAYQTDNLESYVNYRYDVKRVQYSDKARLYFSSNRMYGVSPNYLEVINPDSLPIVQTYCDDQNDPYSYLYSPNGYMTATISSYMAKKFNILYSERNEFYINMYLDNMVEKIQLKASTVFSSRAGLTYSKFAFARSQIGVSFDTYMKLAKIQTYQDLPLKKLKIKIQPGTDTAELGNKLRQQMARKNVDKIWEFAQIQTTLNNIDDLRSNIMYILLIIVLCISFFSLVTTSYVNIINQNTEIAILLTLGYDKARIVRIFIYESFIVVLSSCMIGVVIGMTLAWLMGSQRQLFGDFPVQIEANGLWIICLAAIISSLLSTYEPIREIFKQPINQIFKNQ